MSSKYHGLLEILRRVFNEDKEHYDQRYTLYSHELEEYLKDQ